MANVYILNGPPGCGKDTLADLIVERLGFAKLSFKEALYESTAEHYGMTVEHVKRLCNDRTFKEAPCADFNGLSPRGALIHVSEDIIKPDFGDDFFGERLADKALAYSHVVVPDGGFRGELNAVESEHHVTVIRLHRDGFTFAGDSREYAKDNWPIYTDTKIVDVHLIDGDIEDGFAAVYNEIIKG